jgi:sulfur-carrier protein
MGIKVLFFGVLAEVAGANQKYYVGIPSIEHLKMKISDEYPEIVHYNYRISLNNEIVNTDKELKNGDEVAFLPPFAGG